MCHICGEERELTFEHIPPRRAFNSKPVAIQTILGLIKQSERGLAQAPPLRLKRGMGKRSLCRRCNERTADHYGEAFADWTVQALRYVDRVDGAGKLYVRFKIDPVRVIKQIIVMCLATAEFHDPRLHETLRGLVLKPFERHIPPIYRFHVYLNPCSPDESRMVTNGGMVRLGEGLKFWSLAEVAFPPMGYSWTTTQQGIGSYPSDEGLCDVNHFADFQLGEKRDVWLQIPSRKPFGPSPLNFRE
jgi:hypothetical protein